MICVPVLAEEAPPVYAVVLSGSVYVGPSGPAQFWPSLNFSFGTATLGLSVTSAVGAAAGSVAIRVTGDQPDVSLVQGGFRIYVRGAPGTAFHLEWACTNGYSVNVNPVGLYATGVGHTSAGDCTPSNQGLSVLSYVAPFSLQKTVSNSGTIDGLTSGDTISNPAYPGVVYSYATGFSHYTLTGGQNVGGSANNGIPYVGFASWDANLSFAANLVRAAQTPPTSVILPPVPSGPAPGTPVTLDGSHSFDSDGDSIMQYRWAIQNPTGGTDTPLGSIVQYTWPLAGTYTVTLTVTDSDGQTGTASTSVTVGSANCTPPTGEITTKLNWNAVDTAAFDWIMVLQGGTFAGCSIREVNAAPATDTCWFPGSQLPQVTGIASNSSGWSVNGQNEWGPDTVGWANVAVNVPNTVNYYRAMGRAPCHFVVWQQMQIQDPSGGPWQNYGLISPLIGTIAPTSVSSCRAGVCVSKRY